MSGVITEISSIASLIIVLAAVITLAAKAVKWVIKPLQRTEEQLVKDTSGILVMMKSFIMRDYYDYMERGKINLHARTAFMEFVDKYQSMGGNGISPDLRRDVQKLPIDTTAVNREGGERFGNQQV